MTMVRERDYGDEDEEEDKPTKGSGSGSKKAEKEAPIPDSTLEPEVQVIYSRPKFLAVSDRLS
jgi:hypothetical protein